MSGQYWDTRSPDLPSTFLPPAARCDLSKLGMLSLSLDTGSGWPDLVVLSDHKRGPGGEGEEGWMLIFTERGREVSSGFEICYLFPEMFEWDLFVAIIV